MRRKYRAGFQDALKKATSTFLHPWLSISPAAVPGGAYFMDHTDCGSLVARNVIGDEAVEATRLANGQTTD